MHVYHERWWAVPQRYTSTTRFPCWYKKHDTFICLGYVPKSSTHRTAHDITDHTDHTDHIDHTYHTDHIYNVNHIDHVDHIDHADHLDHTDNLDHIHGMMRRICATQQACAVNNNSNHPALNQQHILQ